MGMYQLFARRQRDLLPLRYKLQVYESCYRSLKLRVLLSLMDRSIVAKVRIPVQAHSSSMLIKRSTPLETIGQAISELVVAI